MRHTLVWRTHAPAAAATLPERSTRAAQLRIAGEISEIASRRATVGPQIRPRVPIPSSVQRLSEAARLTARRADGHWWASAPPVLEESISHALSDTHKKQLRHDIEHVAALAAHNELDLTPADRFFESMPPGRATAVYLASKFMACYASILSVLEEVRRRIGTPVHKVVDYGCDAAAGLWAAMDVFDVLMYVGEARSAPLMRTGIALLHTPALRDKLKQIHAVFRLSSDKPVPLQRGAPVDPGVPPEETLALSAFSLSKMTTDTMRERHIERMWKSKAQLIVLIDEATPRGFASVAAARAQILHYGRTTGRDLHVVAPCPHDKPCPMLHPFGMTKSSRIPKVCAFKQAYHAPQYQRIAENSARSERMAKYTFAVIARGPRPTLQGHIDALVESGHVDAGEQVQLALEKAKGGILEQIRSSEPIEGEILATEEAAMEYQDADESEPVVETAAEDPPDEFPTREAARIDSYAWPRLIATPLKKGGHVTIDACCPTGDLRRFTISKAKGRQAYQDARKLRGSELYAHAHVSSRPSIIAPAAVTDSAAHAAAQSDAIPEELDSEDLGQFFEKFGADLESGTNKNKPTVDPKRIERVAEAEYMYIGPEAQMQTNVPGERNPMRRTRRGPKKRTIETTERGTRANRKLDRSTLDAEMQDAW